MSRLVPSSCDVVIGLWPSRQRTEREQPAAITRGSQDGKRSPIVADGFVALVGFGRSGEPGSSDASELVGMGGDSSSFMRLDSPRVGDLGARTTAPTSGNKGSLWFSGHVDAHHALP